MSRPNLVLELSVLKGVNQIRRNIGRLSCSYMDLDELFQTEIELSNQESYSVELSQQLIIKTSGTVKATITNNSVNHVLNIKQLLVLDSGAENLTLVNEGAEPIQVIIMSSR